MDEFKITQIEVDGNNVKSAPDTIKAAGSITTRDAKHWFDRLPELIVRRFNDFVTYIADNFYNKEEVDDAIANKVVDVGAGDMSRADYDSDEDGIVDNAENGFFVYTHTSDGLSGSGALGRFKAADSVVVNSIKVNGTTCSVKCGGESSIELTEGSWYTFILDGNTINFNTGSGLTTSKLQQATAETGDVISGKKFYSKDRILKTGTLALKGNAVAGDVISGKTFHNTDVKQAVTGTLSLSGNAAAGDVINGKTFYSADPKTKMTGTLVEQDVYTQAVSAQQGEGDVYVRIPKGAYRTASSTGYPEVKVNNGALASAIGLTASKMYAGNEVLGVKGTAVVEYDLSTLGTPTYAHSTGTALAAQKALVYKDCISVYGINAASGWGSGVYTFPNKIDVSKYSTLKVHSIVSRAETYTGGDTTNINISGKATNTTSRLNKMTHTFDVSSKKTFELTVTLGWHANNYGSVTIYKIELS